MCESYCDLLRTYSILAATFWNVCELYSEYQSWGWCCAVLSPGDISSIKLSSDLPEVREVIEDDLDAWLFWLMYAESSRVICSSDGVRLTDIGFVVNSRTDLCIVILSNCTILAPDILPSWSTMSPSSIVFSNVSSNDSLLLLELVSSAQWRRTSTETPTIIIPFSRLEDAFSIHVLQHFVKPYYENYIISFATSNSNIQNLYICKLHSWVLCKAK